MKELIQGSAGWLQARAGSLGASQIADMMAKTKSGWGAGRKNLMWQLAIERITQAPTETYVNGAMQRGNDMEPVARDLYCFIKDVEVEQVGLVKHPSIVGTHASPDGLVSDDGCIEIKCPASSTHGEYLFEYNEKGTAPGKYIPQMQWVMACTGRKWCDFVSFDDRFPTDLQVLIIQVARDDEYIATLEAEVVSFLESVDETVEKLLKLRAAS